MTTNHVVKRVREQARGAFFNFVRKVADTDDARATGIAALEGMLMRRGLTLLAELPDEPTDYPELGRARKEPACQRDDIVFITGRFRSGSTLLWNIFRNIDGMTAYYEPLNERRWFDSQTRGERVDSTHRKVDEYWHEYEGLNELADHYRLAWIDRRLYMDGADFDYDLQRYIEIMIERAPGRPALQFNRVDFRLPWLRERFPNAKIVHLYRHPRDQWLSTLVDPKAFPREGSIADFAPYDKFYLLNWARDLKTQFPFLDERIVQYPYRLFYLMWKLSYRFGLAFADHSLSFEDLVTQPAEQIHSLLAAVEAPSVDLNALERLIDRPPLGKWKQYASDDWFRAHEEFCENLIAEYGDAPSRQQQAPRMTACVE